MTSTARTVAASHEPRLGFEIWWRGAMTPMSHGLSCDFERDKKRFKVFLETDHRCVRLVQMTESSKACHPSSHSSISFR